MRFLCFALILYGAGASGQTGVVNPLAELCNASLPSVLCINKYASVMPYHFFRPSSFALTEYTFGSTSVPNDASFGLVNQSDFLVFDRTRGLELLGPEPSYELVFSLPPVVNEAPVYVASQNKLYFSRLTNGFLPQLVIDLNAKPPALSEYLPDPPVYGVNGATFHNGLIYWGASGGNISIGGTEQRSGIRTLDPATNKSTTILNNYFGSYFNGVDDLFVHPNGDIWFTDPGMSSPHSTPIVIIPSLITVVNSQTTPGSTTSPTPLPSSKRPSIAFDPQRAQPTSSKIPSHNPTASPSPQTPKPSTSAIAAPLPAPFPPPAPAAPVLTPQANVPYMHTISAPTQLISVTSVLSI